MIQYTNPCLVFGMKLFLRCMLNLQTKRNQIMKNFRNLRIVTKSAHIGTKIIDLIMQQSLKYKRTI